MVEWRTAEIILEHPIDSGVPGMVINKLTFREPDAAALEQMEQAGLAGEGKPSIAQSIAFAQSLLVEPADREIIRKLHRDDFIRLAEVLEPLAGGG